MNFSAFLYGSASLAHSVRCWSVISPLLRAPGRREEASILFTKYTNASFKVSASALTAELHVLEVIIIRVCSVGVSGFTRK